MRYLITSRLGALGGRPGEYVERKISPDQERRLIEAGHITRAPKARKRQPQEVVVTTEEESAFPIPTRTEVEASSADSFESNDDDKES